jgi:hypothetical protein
MTDAVHILICVPWSRYSGLVPSIQLNCTKCGTPVAVDKKNVFQIEPMHLTIQCTDCSKDLLEDPATNPGGLIGGRRYDDLTEATLAALESISRNRG